MLLLINLLKILLDLGKLARPRRPILFCVTGHTQTPNCSKFLRLITSRQVFSSLALLQSKNPESFYE